MTDGAETEKADERPLTFDEMEKFSVNDKTKQLYWNGKEVLFRKQISIGIFERWVAGFGVGVAFASFMLDLLKTFCIQ